MTLLQVGLQVDINRSQEVIVIFMRPFKMKSLILTCVMLFTSSAWAEWVQVSQTSEVVFYIDPETIRKNGNIRLVWVIQNLLVRNNDGGLSRRARSEYDCAKERLRTLSISLHSEPMAAGTILHYSPNDNATQWVDIPPATPFARILKYVCAK